MPVDIAGPKELFCQDSGQKAGLDTLTINKHRSIQDCRKSLLQVEQQVDILRQV